MKFFLKSKARYGLLLLVLGGGIGSVAAQQDNTKTTPRPGTTLPQNDRMTPNASDTLVPPTAPNPTAVRPPDMGNPVDTMQNTAPLPPEGRTRQDSMPNNQGNAPNQGMAPTQRSTPGQATPPNPTSPANRGTVPNQATPTDRGTNTGTTPTRRAPRGTAPKQGVQSDSIERRMVPRQDGTLRDMPLDSIDKQKPKTKGRTPAKGKPGNTANKRKMPNDGKSGMKPAQGVQLDSMDRSKTMDKTKMTSGTKPKAKKTGTKKKYPAKKARTAPATQTKTMDKTGIKPAVVSDSLRRSAPAPRPKSGGN